VAICPSSIDRSTEDESHEVITSRSRGRQGRHARRAHLEAIGRLTGNRSTGSKGKAARARGASRSAKGRAKRAASDAGL
jgi:hypothetical protein